MFRKKNLASLGRLVVPPSRLDGNQVRHDAIARALAPVSLRGICKRPCWSWSDAEEASSLDGLLGLGSGLYETAARIDILKEIK